jgi:hypothetical protein
MLLILESRWIVHFVKSSVDNDMLHFHTFIVNLLCRKSAKAIFMGVTLNIEKTGYKVKVNFLLKYVTHKSMLLSSLQAVNHITCEQQRHGM